MDILGLSKDDIKRFNEKFVKRGEDECWEWTACKDDDGYGLMWLNGNNKRAHRIALYIKEGCWGEQACHTCDHPYCVNPTHLWWGTSRDNIDDMIEKGRSLKGEKNGKSKLTAEQVDEIRREHTGKWGQKTALGKKYNVSSNQIDYIIRGKSWSTQTN